MNGSGGGGSSAASQAISGSGPVTFGGDIPPWLIGVGIGAGVLILGLMAWAFTRKS